tara:strand:+ start:122 stop:352 length:231 start_codon:yes stop_codon:yes gene_type:complete
MDGDWVTKHKKVKAHDYEYGWETDNKIIYYYAVDTHGYGREVKGTDKYYRNYYQTKVGFIRHKFSSLDNLTITILE